jgi:hypothetical protein
MEVDLEVVDLVEVDLVEIDMMVAVVGVKVAVVMMTEGGADHVTEIVGVVVVDDRTTEVGALLMVDEQMDPVVGDLLRLSESPAT